MGRTVAPELDPEVLERLHAYAREFRPLFRRIDRYLHGRTYLHGLLLDGERKSIEPLSRRVPGGNEQALQQFVNQSPWDPAPVLAAYRARMAAAFASEHGLIVVDDTSFPKQGRVWVGHRWERGRPIGAIPDPEESARWLLVEWRKDGTVKYALSNLPAETTLEQAVPWWKERWQVERGYLQLKDELGLDHFEGRSWPGFHHHAALTFLAYGFLALERHRAATEQVEHEPPGEAGRGA